MTDILLIEDNKELAELLQAFLNKEGFSLYHVGTGEEALLWLQSNTAQLLLLDIMLPGIDGFATYNKCSNHDYQCTISEDRSINRI